MAGVNKAVEARGCNQKNFISSDDIHNIVTITNLDTSKPLVIQECCLKRYVTHSELKASLTLRKKKNYYKTH